MGAIIPITGKVKYSITLDPGVWIFDERRADLDSFFIEGISKPDELEEYTKRISKHWDTEITEGAKIPETTPVKTKKEELLTGTFGIELGHFLKNAEPHEDADSLVIETKEGLTQIPLLTAFTMVAGFSLKGKPLVEDGPLHLYFKDGSNRNTPIKYVKEFRIQ